MSVICRFDYRYGESPNVLKLIILGLFLICIGSHMSALAQSRCRVIIRPALVDEVVDISVERPFYFPGDTIHISIIREDSAVKCIATPTITINGTTLKPVEPNLYSAVIPQNTIPGSYPVHLTILDTQGHRLIYETKCFVVVEEYQEIERIDKYVQVGPGAGSKDSQRAVTLSRAQIRNLKVIFNRDSIKESMGPQFVIIRTSVLPRKGPMTETSVRHMMTFRSSGDPALDRTMFVRCRTAYGAYSVIHSEEIDGVQVPQDSLPSWAVIQVRIEPDYAINVGAVDQSNVYTCYYRVKGPSIETGFTLGVPKVLYDTQAKDSVEYGKTSAMLRFYYVSSVSGQRFPVSFGIGTFGVNTPIDVGNGRGGFAASFFLDIVELARRFNWNIPGKASAGLELTPFLPINRRSRILFDAHVGLAL